MSGSTAYGIDDAADLEDSFKPPVEDQSSIIIIMPQFDIGVLSGGERDGGVRRSEQESIPHGDGDVTI